MKVLFVEYPKCSTCKKAGKWLQEHGVGYDDRHIVEQLQKTKTPVILVINKIDTVDHDAVFGVIEAYRNLGLGERFFTPMFEKLIGVGYVREMILSGASEAEIRACWQEDLRRFRRQRQPYLLYAE